VLVVYVTQEKITENKCTFTFVKHTLKTFEVSYALFYSLISGIR